MVTTNLPPPWSSCQGGSWATILMPTTSMGVEVVGDYEHFLDGATAAGRWPRIITVFRTDADRDPRTVGLSLDPASGLTDRCSASSRT